MRKALIGLLMAAAAVTPLASAAAQNHDWGGRGDRQQAKAERQLQRSERREARIERRAEAPVRARQNDGPRGFARPQISPPRQVERNFADRRDSRGDRWDRNRAWNPSQQDQSRQWRGSDRSNWNDHSDRARSGQWDRNRSGNWNGNHDGRWSGRHGDRNWNHNWRNDRRYDWQRYRYSNRSRYHLPRYYAPYRGYGYSRFSVGFFLEPLFYSSNYWISDPWQYRLPPAYPGTRWVRYYDDVLLVDMYSGEVIDVIYDFFW